MNKAEWGEYRINDLFKVETSKKRFDANKVSIYSTGEYAYIVRMGSNNGQRGFINEDEKFLNEGNTFSFGQDTATVFYQSRPYFTGDKIKILKPKTGRICEKNAPFFTIAISKAFSAFSWGSASFSIDVIGKQKIRLPSFDGSPDFQFMNSFVAELKLQRLNMLMEYLVNEGLQHYEIESTEQCALDKFSAGQIWTQYRIGDLFHKVKTKKLPYKVDELPKEANDQYSLPCLTSSFKNQGLNYFVPKDGATVLKNVISIPSNSDVYRAYFQSREFTVLSDAYAIDWKLDDVKLTTNQYLFMVMCINKVTDRPIYSYKNKLGGWNIVQNKYIQLPTKEGKIDLEFMDAFISAIKKSVIKDVVLYVDQRKSEAKTV